MYTHAPTYQKIYIHVYACVYIYICAYVYVNACIYIHIFWIYVRTRTIDVDSTLQSMQAHGYIWLMHCMVCAGARLSRACRDPKIQRVLAVQGQLDKRDEKQRGSKQVFWTTGLHQDAFLEMGALRNAWQLAGAC